MRAAALEHVHLLAAADEHEVDPVGLRVRGGVLGEVVEVGDRQVGTAVHLTLPLTASRGWGTRLGEQSARERPGVTRSRGV